MTSRKHILFLVFGIFSQMLSSQQTQWSILFFGDLMAHGVQQRSAYNKETGQYDFSSVFRYISPYLSQADFCIGNLETPLGVKPYKGYPQFSAPPALAAAIKEAGADVLVTANNHACDRRLAGIRSTINILDSINIYHTGSFVSMKDKYERDPLILYSDRIRIALYSATYGTNGIPVPAPAVINSLNKPRLIEDFRKMDSLNPDYKIVFLHWGKEYSDQPVPTQKELGNFIHDQGIPLIIGSHPHVIEPMEYDSIRHTGTVYSLGNFISNQRKYKTDGGAMVLAVLSRNNEGKIYLSSLHYILTWVYKKKFKDTTGKVSYQFYVLPADEFSYKPYFFEDMEDYNKMLGFLKHARKLLSKHNKQVEEIHPFSEMFWRMVIR